jgi:hypothetical protein
MLVVAAPKRLAWERSAMGPESSSSTTMPSWGSVSGASVSFCAASSAVASVLGRVSASIYPAYKNAAIVDKATKKTTKIQKWHREAKGRLRVMGGSIIGTIRSVSGWCVSDGLDDARRRLCGEIRPRVSRACGLGSVMYGTPPVGDPARIKWGCGDCHPNRTDIFTDITH